MARVKLAITVLMLFLFSACGPRYGDFYPCHEDGTVKPRIVLLPISDVTGESARADELMQGIRYQLLDRGNLYVYPQETVNLHLGRNGISSFFSSDISYAKQFGGADFIVATELVQCRSERYGNVEDKCMPPHLQRKNLLMVKLRVRMIDLRCQEPTIVWQEILSRQLLVPYRKTGEAEVDISCFGSVSQRLIEDFVQRLEDIAWRLH